VTGKQRRPTAAPTALLPIGVLLGLLVLVWAATTGPVRMLRDSGRRYVFEPPTPTASPSDGSTPAGSLREVTKDIKPIADLSWLGDLIATGALLLFCIAVLLGLRWLWLHRWHPPEQPEEVPFDVLPAQVAASISNDRAAQLEAVAEGAPRNGIVACWLRLQASVEEAGVPPRRSDTSAEFVQRVLRSLDLDPRAVATLAALYREARFSEHPVGEDARTAARAALESLHDDLAARRMTP
jgi:uncharacterized protein DUF4129